MRKREIQGGAASRTVVSPLERLKIIQCVQSLPHRGCRGAFHSVPSPTSARLWMLAWHSLSSLLALLKFEPCIMTLIVRDRQIQPPGENQYKGVFRSLVRMWKEEGVRGYMRGNGVNCLRIVPYRCVAGLMRCIQGLDLFLAQYNSLPMNISRRQVTSSTSAGV